MKITRVYHGDDDQTHFEDMELETHRVEGPLTKIRCYASGKDYMTKILSDMVSLVESIYFCNFGIAVLKVVYQTRSDIAVGPYDRE